MNDEAKTLKAFFSELLAININNNLDVNYLSKQYLLENVWAVITTLEENSVRSYEIEVCIDELNCALELLETIKTKDDTSYIKSEINRIIDMLKREIQ